MKASTRVVVNTFVQYLRTFIAVIVSLFTARVVLENLGTSDYGIFTLVGGVISMLSFIQVSLSKGTQRFLSYYYGRGDEEFLFQIFNNSRITQLLVSIVTALLLYSFTPFIFNHLLNISSDREAVAHYVYYISIVALFFNFQSTPYLATLIARENMIFSSIIQLIETLLKLPIAYSLIVISKDARLTWYSLSMASLTCMNFICYRMYCHRKYYECRGHLSYRLFNWSLAKQMFSFFGWGIYGTFCVVGRTQGISILLNRFYTTTINASFGIAMQVSGQINVLVSALTNAINPQIIRAEGSGNRQKMFRLAETSCKFSYLLFAIPSIPIMFFMSDILTLWLNSVPPRTSMFCVFIILSTLVDQLTMNLATANNAIGKIRNFTIGVYSVKLITLPIAYSALRYGYGPVGVMCVYVITESLGSIVRLVFLKQTGLSIMSYVENVYLKIIPPTIINTAMSCLLSYVLHGWFFLLAIAVSAIVTAVVAYKFSLTKQEKSIIDSLFLSHLHLNKTQ